MSNSRFNKAVGLRTEMVIQLSLIIISAVVLTGFLAISFSEKVLLEEKIESIKSISDILSQAISEQGDLQLSFFLSDSFSMDNDIDGIAIYDENKNVISIRGRSDIINSFKYELLGPSITKDYTIKTEYTTALNPFYHRENYILITTAIIKNKRIIGYLQISSSLDNLRNKIFKVEKYLSAYIILFSVVFVLFGLYLSAKNIIGPIRRLKKATAHIASGDLNYKLNIEGPPEIADLAQSFNTMTESLKESRRSIENTMEELQKINNEIRQAQKELIQSEKMATIGRLAAGMAHEVGNPLGAVIGYLEFLKEEVERNDLKEITYNALEETHRIDHLVKEVLDYATPDTSDSQLFNPVEVVEDSLEILNAQNVFKNNQVEVNMPPSLSLVNMPRGRLLQVVINLLLNARDASEEGSYIYVSGWEMVGMVMLEIQDKGMGMDDEHIEKIFDPFFTTKEPGMGRGLGLSICHRIIEEAGGKIKVESEKGKGSSFTLILPKAS